MLLAVPSVLPHVLLYFCTADAQYYTAIRYVSAHGDVLQAHEQPLLLRTLASCQLAWPATSSCAVAPAGGTDGTGGTDLAGASTSQGGAAGGVGGKSEAESEWEGQGVREGLESAAPGTQQQQPRRRLLGLPALLRPQARERQRPDASPPVAGTGAAAAAASNATGPGSRSKRGLTVSIPGSGWEVQGGDGCGEQGAGMRWPQGPPACALAWHAHAMLHPALSSGGRMAWGWRAGRGAGGGALRGQRGWVAGSAGGGCPGSQVR